MIAALVWATLALCQSATAQTLEGTAERVIDGDTFDFAAFTIRICGIDAPERGETGYREAKTALAQMIKGRQVQCIPVGSGSICDGRSKPFSHKRVVAQCFAGNEDIAAWMVKSGHACDWVKFSGGAYPGGCRK